MNCNQIRELLPGLAAGIDASTPEVEKHVASCNECATHLLELRKTMALLDEWQAPEPSPYFDTRMQARLREEMAKPQPGWFAWLRRPALAAALMVLMAIGVGLFLSKNGRMYQRGDDTIATVDSQTPSSNPGTAVGDLQSLEKNHDLYSDFDLLDDLEVQHDVVANP